MSLNRCEFIGRLGKDPEMRAMPQGGSVANFSIAVSKKYKDKQTGEKKEQTTWVPVVIFGKLADVCDQYLQKGSQVFIAGEFRVRKWQDQNGQDRYSTEIVGNEMTMLDGRGDQPQAQPQPASPAAGPDYDAPTGGFDDQDIPFNTHMKNNEYLI
jgi:single-strand DNA-binding protein